ETATAKVVGRVGKERKAGIDPDKEVALAVSPDGKRLAVWDAGYHDLRVWDLSTGRPLLHERKGDRGKKVLGPIPERPNPRPIGLTFSPDGAMLAAGGLGGEPEILVWEMTSAKPRRHLSGHAGR